MDREWNPTFVASEWFDAALPRINPNERTAAGIESVLVREIDQEKEKMGLGCEMKNVGGYGRR